VLRKENKMFVLKHNEVAKARPVRDVILVEMSAQYMKFPVREITSVEKQRDARARKSRRDGVIANAVKQSSRLLDGFVPRHDVPHRKSRRDGTCLHVPVTPLKVFFKPF
jgi:hypothetical protein